MVEVIQKVGKFLDNHEKELVVKGDAFSIFAEIDGKFVQVEGVSPHNHNVQIENLSMFSLDTIDKLFTTMCGYYAMDIDLYDGDILLKEYRTNLRIIK